MRLIALITARLLFMLSRWSRDTGERLLKWAAAARI